MSQPNDDWCFSEKEWNGVLSSFDSQQGLDNYLNKNDLIEDDNVKDRRKQLSSEESNHPTLKKRVRFPPIYDIKIRKVSI